MPGRIFVDSDVIISSLISPSGAAYLLLHHPYVKPVISDISDISYKELEIVIDRLHLDKKKLKNLVKSKFEIVTLKESLEKMRTAYKTYTSDKNDSHIIAGAKAAKVKFLVTYNLKHFYADRIKQDLDIMVVTPGIYLQYLRSLQ